MNKPINKKISNPDMRGILKKSRRLRSNSDTKSVPPVRQFCVLVVDDEIVTRMRLQRLLERSGYKVELAEHGREALEVVQQKEIDLVLCDMMMPVMNGLMAIRMIRQMFPSDKLPVVMMTSSGEREQILEAFDSGANDFVSKPVDNEVVLARLQNQLLIKKAHLALRESEERYALATKGTRDGIWDWNLVTGELYLSKRWLEMVGMSPDERRLKGSEWLNRIHREDRTRVMVELEAHLCGEKDNFETELRMRVQDDQYRWMLCRGLAVFDESDIACRIAGSLSDITEGKVADAMTGLPNRVLFYDRVQQRVEQFQESPDQLFAVIYMDVDDFKLINDNLGHEVGDQFLVEVSKRLNAALYDADAIVARLGGDEFGILVNQVNSTKELVAVAERIHAEMTRPFLAGERDVVTRGSMGIALPDPNTIGANEVLSAKLLLSQSDAAMYRAKRQGELPYCIFESEILEESALLLELGNELRHSLSRGEMAIHYQPIIDIESRNIVGFEALLRWIHPERGFVSPAQFIPIAENNGFIVELGQWVLSNACQQISKWNQQFGRKFSVSVNVSTRQIKGSQFLEVVRQALANSGLPPEQLCLEVTESLLMQNAVEIVDLLNEVRRLNVKISIDDFGTGYSSLAYLHQMPMEIIKIDKSFVNEMNRSEKHFAIVRTIVALAKSLQLRTIAEGIENEDQARMLESLGCEQAQGFLFSKAIPLEGMESFVREFNAVVPLSYRDEATH